MPDGSRSSSASDVVRRLVLLARRGVAPRGRPAARDRLMYRPSRLRCSTSAEVIPCGVPVRVVALGHEGRLRLVLAGRLGFTPFLGARLRRPESRRTSRSSSSSTRGPCLLLPRSMSILPAPGVVNGRLARCVDSPFWRSCPPAGQRRRSRANSPSGGASRPDAARPRPGAARARPGPGADRGSAGRRSAAAWAFSAAWSPSLASRGGSTGSSAGWPAWMARPRCTSALISHAEEDQRELDEVQPDQERDDAAEAAVGRVVRAEVGHVEAEAERRRRPRRAAPPTPPAVSQRNRGCRTFGAIQNSRASSSITISSDTGHFDHATRRSRRCRRVQRVADRVGDRAADDQAGPRPPPCSSSATAVISRAAAGAASRTAGPPRPRRSRSRPG